MKIDQPSKTSKHFINIDQMSMLVENISLDQNEGLLFDIGESKRKKKKKSVGDL